MQLSLAGVLLLLSVNLHAENQTGDFPANFTARYELHKSGLAIAETQYQLSRDQQNIFFDSVTQRKGLFSLFGDERITEKTLFTISDTHNIQLKSYQYSQTGEKIKTVHSHVDWDKQSISTVIDNHPPSTIRFNDMIWDKHSVLLALMSQAKGKKKLLSFQVLDKSIVKTFEFSFIGTKEIEFNEDEWKISTVWQRSHQSRTTIFYLDPTTAFIPLKIEQYKNKKLRATLWLTELNNHD